MQEAIRMGKEKTGPTGKINCWQESLLAPASPCAELLSTQTPAEMNLVPGASWGRWLPLPKVVERDSDAALNSPTSKRASKGRTKGWEARKDLQRHPVSVLNQQRCLGAFSFPKRPSHNITALVVRNLLVTTRFH